MSKQHSSSNRFDLIVSFLSTLVISLLGLFAYLSYTIVSSDSDGLDTVAVYSVPDSNFTHLWTAPSDWRMMYLAPEEKNLVLYGRELISHTSDYLGPKGSVKSISNGMNCQNCHLNAGTQPWGNN
ncbi:MAG: hypothetical protein AABZ56_07535, partial [Bacteroidota bacterium]